MPIADALLDPDVRNADVISTPVLSPPGMSIRPVPLLLGRPQDNWHSVFCGHGHDIVDCSGRAVITPPGEAVPDHAGRGQITGHLSPLATSPALVEE
jgi:hypothetical protein